jgi:hypothetical protein
LNETVFAVGPVARSLRVSELMYHPLDTGNPEDPNTEFIELTNIANPSINLNLVQFTKGSVTPSPASIFRRRYCLVVKDLAAFQAKYGSKLPRSGNTAAVSTTAASASSWWMPPARSSRALCMTMPGSRPPMGQATPWW